MRENFYKILAGVLSLAVLFFLPRSVSATTDTVTATGTWVAPAGVFSVTVDAWAGGGGGGKGSFGGNTGGGGGGGAYSQQTGIRVTPGVTYTVTVGAGGLGGIIGGAASTDGGDSWFLSPATVLAKGGGLGSLSFTNGIGGLASAGVGTTKFSGGSGDVGDGVSLGGGGGGGAGTTADGSNAVTTTGGAGGSVGGGTGGNGLTPTTGSTKGGGGGGATTGGSGADGARGEVQITYTANNSATVAIKGSTNVQIKGSGNIKIQ